MNGYIDATNLFIGIATGLQKEHFTINSSLDEIVIKTSKDNLAYIDNRRDALKKYGFDLWEEISGRFKCRTEFMNWLRTKGIGESILYSKSEHFPDFLFKVRKQDNNLTSGSLLELKDSKGRSISSFNSTLPTKYKSLNEVDIINGTNLVSRISSALDAEASLSSDYYDFQRRNFYLIRTHKEDGKKLRISIVDGSFFETVPKEHLIYQMFLGILQKHLEKKEIKIPEELLEEFNKSLSYISDQTIISASQNIEKASIRPRLRIMAEVHPEGNPHSNHYPEICERSVNLIIQSSPDNEPIKKSISKNISDVRIFSIKHKRNGEHLVFQLLV